MKTITETGFLVDGINHIGGEGSGWQLQSDDLGNIEVDVEQVKDQALKLRGKFVTISGYYITREYIERGPTEILVAEKLFLAAGNPKGA